MAARSGFDVEFSIYGETILRRRLLRFADRGEDMSPAWPEVARILERSTEENFRTRGVASGIRWRDLSQPYARRTGRAPSERILRLSGRLWASLVSAGDPEHIYEPEPDGLRWGSRVPYGKYHQSTRPRRVLPYRPPVKLSERDKREAVRTIHRTLMRAAGRAA